jgi:putative transposase
MPDYRRFFVPGGSFFFTVVTYRRRPLFSDANAKSILGQVIRECQAEWPFEINAIVLLHDHLHLHTIWTLPRGDSNYPARWSRIKREFTKKWLASGGQQLPVSAGARRERRAGNWQRRFWEHTIRDEDDFEIRFDYIHFNPVKHGYVKCPKDWLDSSFHRWVKAGVYPLNWACGNRNSPPDFRSIENECGEP